NNLSLARQALPMVLQAVPGFVPAQEMLQRLEAAAEQSTDLIDSLRLREINYIIFPNWSLSEDLLTQELTHVIEAIANHPDQSKITLLIYINGISEEDANLLLSGVVMNLVIQEKLEVENLEISLVEKLEPSQWEVLVPHLQARISLAHEHQEAIALAKVANLPSRELDSLSEIRSFR
ncbi:MAG: glycosyl transferase, partial [Cyanobacteriota bacterium]